MTFKTSDVAVCCSRPSFVSLKRRAFSIATTAWSANVSTSATCVGVNVDARFLRSRITPMIASALLRGTPRMARSVLIRSFGP